ncbi:MAG: hypothetical protein AVDCRST_MAG19-4483 [uncultured Thermomicrobiales bacterium]|uniref:Uncharacterized protein n=1 Tax=uncultured Thermomicrobiales bacterium TaxID=1645740 RepID=A0A6J4VU52_9BACT|nr:MAG: hypothetical protein AVDCRST_MAG19-4483 [uncultured Thermomicrobiales bacterium]
MRARGGTVAPPPAAQAQGCAHILPPPQSTQPVTSTHFEPAGCPFASEQSASVWQIGPEG